MTIKEAIKTTEDFITDLEASEIPIYANEKEALEILIHDAEILNEIVNNIPHCTDYKSYSCEEIGEGLHKIAERIGDNREIQY